MSQCFRCRKYVHTGCDPEADRALVQRKKEMNPDYDYQCPPCKVNPPASVSAGESVDFLGVDSASSTTGQEQQPPIPSSLISSETESCLSVDNSDSATGLSTPQWSSTTATTGLSSSLGDEMAKTGVVASTRVGVKTTSGGGAVQSAGKIARKRISGPAGGVGGRPKGAGKNAFGASSGTSSSGSGFNRKANKVADFSRKRGPKPKMRGVFGAPGIGLQRPINSSTSEGTTGATQSTTGNGPAGTNEGEPCLENRLVLCSATDSFVVDQDTCAMCGSFGLDQEGRLIACAQCGQVR